MLRAVLNKSWRQHPTRHQLYGHLSPITKTIQVRRTRHAGHCWKSKDELISDVLLWTPTYGRAKAGRPARTYIQQLCEDTGCNLEDLPEAMNDREKWREGVRDIRAGGTTWRRRNIYIQYWRCSLKYTKGIPCKTSSKKVINKGLLNTWSSKTRSGTADEIFRIKFLELGLLSLVIKQTDIHENLKMVMRLFKIIIGLERQTRYYLLIWSRTKTLSTQSLLVSTSLLLFCLNLIQQEALVV